MDGDAQSGVEEAVRLPAVPASVAPLRQAARRWAEASGLDEERVADVALAVTEAATNAVLHGFVDRRPGDVLLWHEAGEGEVTFCVCDDGRGLTPRIDSPGLGLGLPTIGRVADALDVGPAPDGRGTQVRMVFTAPGADPDAALRRRLASAYAQLHEAVLVHDEDGRFLYANAPALGLLGLTEPELAAQSPGATAARFDIRLPDGRPPALDDWPHRRLFAGEDRPEPLLARAVDRETGRTTWTETTATLLVDPPSGRRLALGTVRDLTEVVRTAERERLLAEAGRRLQLAAVDLEATFGEIAALAVPGVADWCAVDVADDAGRLRRVALAHTDPRAVEVAVAIRARWPADPSAPGGLYGVLRSGEPLVVPHVTAELLQAVEEPERREALAAIGLRSVVCVPLRGRREAVGVLVLAHADSGRAFDDDDVRFAQDLADRAGVAVENARMITGGRPAPEGGTDPAQAPGTAG